jgi:hypothetical protein
MTMFEQLAAEFPRDAVHWRAQTVTKAGDKALALAYLDARDVMDRLDSVCTPGGWRNIVTETPKGRLIATIEIKIDGEWVGKTDGAGDTAVEGEKGGISDALKRAGVLWGIGRYLYRMDAVWAPCETTEYNGKKQWKAWKGSPWNSVRTAARQPLASVPEAEAEPETVQVMRKQIRDCQTIIALKQWKRDHGLAADATGYGPALVADWNARKIEVEAMDRVAA